MLRTSATILLVALVLLAGCVKRTVTIESIPSGAEVFLDGKLVGNTPLSLAFTYYGNHHIRIVKEGYTTLLGTLALKAPMYDKPGIDFFSENIVPWTIRDDHAAVFTLFPEEKADAAEAVKKARDFSRKSDEFIKSKSQDNK
ncbi:MAG: PEGA domain-containing protein [Candidatus Brocadiia bacterium]